MRYTCTIVSGIGKNCAYYVRRDLTVSLLRSRLMLWYRDFVEMYFIVMFNVDQRRTRTVRSSQSEKTGTERFTSKSKYFPTEHVITVFEPPKEVCHYE